MSRSRSRESENAEALILPDGQVSAEAADLLEDLFIHSHHPSLIEAESDIIEQRKRLPWWKRPSPLWILIAYPFSSIAFSATMAPKVEIYTQLACLAHKPEIFWDTLISIPQYTLPAIANASASIDTSSFVEVLGQSNSCAADPVVQAAVAKFTAGTQDSYLASFFIIHSISQYRLHLWASYLVSLRAGGAPLVILLSLNSAFHLILFIVFGQAWSHSRSRNIYRWSPRR